MTDSVNDPSGIPGVPGIESPLRLAKWLAGASLADVGELRSVRLIAGGRSNLTYRLDTSSQPIVLRRPPLGHVLPTAHDMNREYRVLSALAGTAVPVPVPLALCPDPDIIGAPFYLMRFVDGAVLRTVEDGGPVSADQAAELSNLMAETLASIHSVDVQAVELGDFGRPAGYLARQLDRWQRQRELSNTRELPGYTELVQRLAAGLPEPMTGASEPADGTLVHGDFRLDNTIIELTRPPRVAAVVDWEMSTLGDPLADLGLTLMYWRDTPLGPPEVTVGATVTSLPGFWSRDQFAARYAELTGRDVSSIGYYIAFGYFKLAIVLEGIHARFMANQTVGEGFEREGQAVPILIERAHQMLDSL
ncbi:MAG: phosphotransferase family protein [Actinobacteria bacterium]|nr:phosphotransferase family protein [Actinomycetota bacterium]